MVLGLAMSFLAVLGTLYFIIDKLFFGTVWPDGLPTIAVLILFSIGMNAILLGIVGEYIGRIYQNVKRTPLTITEAIVDRHGASAPARAADEKSREPSGPTVLVNTIEAPKAEILAR
jgi:dolichol-phosphate mannosyltransferase